LPRRKHTSPPTPLRGYVLSREEILELIKGVKPLVKGYIDLERQLQPAGFEFTVGELAAFSSAGTIDFSNKHRRISEITSLKLSDRKSTFLPTGSYVIRYNETASLPLDLLSVVLPRSSLMRSGAILYTAVWDPGYEGHGQGLLCVYNPHGIHMYKNARICQAIFLRLSAPVKEGYRGIYQREGKQS